MTNWYDEKIGPRTIRQDLRELAEWHPHAAEYCEKLFRKKDQNTPECRRLREDIMELSTNAFSVSFFDTFLEIATLGFYDGSNTSYDGILARRANEYIKKCRTTPEQQKSKKSENYRVAVESSFNPSYAVSAEAMAAARPSGLELFARDAADAAKNVLLPTVVIGGLVFGAMKAIETGDTSTIQRAWALAVR